MYKTLFHKKGKDVTTKEKRGGWVPNNMSLARALKRKGIFLYSSILTVTFNKMIQMVQMQVDFYMEVINFPTSMVYKGRPSERPRDQWPLCAPPHSTGWTALPCCLYFKLHLTWYFSFHVYLLLRCDRPVTTNILITAMPACPGDELEPSHTKHCTTTLMMSLWVLTTLLAALQRPPCLPSWEAFSQESQHHPA